MKNIKAFTLVEIMIVVVILGVLASLAMVNYRGVMLEQRVRNATAAVRTMHSAAIIYEAQNGSFYPANGWISLSTFNTAHGTNIQPVPNMTLYYSTLGPPPGGFEVGALYDNGGPEEFQIVMDGIADDGTNLCCHHGTCSGLEVLPDC